MRFFIFNKRKYFKDNKGFTLIELLIAIFIFMVGLIGSYMVIQYQITSIKISNSRLIAIYLGQEGIEIVKNIRDENLIRSTVESPAPSWYEGIGDGCYISDYNDVSLTKIGDLSCASCQTYAKIRLTVGGFYNNSTGTNTKFMRQIKIEDDGTGTYKKVSVIVCWVDNGKQYEVTIRDNLYGYWTP